MAVRCQQEGCSSTVQADLAHGKREREGWPKTEKYERGGLRQGHDFSNADRTDRATPSAKSHPASDTVVLRPDSGSVDSASCASCAPCTQAPHVVASGTSGHPSPYWVPSGHMQLSNPASHASRLQPQHHRTSGFTTTPEYPPSPMVRKGYFLAQKI